MLHIGLLAASLLVLPVVPAAAWKPTGHEDPILRILGLLAVTIGIPFFLLSTTGPQAWYARRFDGAIPYRLYALSNAGSMFALIGYPVLVEPTFTTRFQAMAWSLGYAAFIALCGITAYSVRNYSGQKAVAEAEIPAQAPDWKLHLWWVLLPACASVLLLAITNFLSQDVAAIPFLWVLPLSLYLLSFILCFDREGWYRRSIFLKFFAVALVATAYGIRGSVEGLSRGSPNRCSAGQTGSTGGRPRRPVDCHIPVLVGSGERAGRCLRSTGDSRRGQAGGRPARPAHLDRRL
jgi:hypothetical protein